MKVFSNRYFTKVFIVAAIGLLSACNPTKSKQEEINNTNMIDRQIINETDVFASINLTVSEGKRLIARGIVNHPLVKQKLESGMIIITRGTTNTYIAEELAALSAPRGSFVTGNNTPEKGKALDFTADKTAEIVLVNGKKSDMTYKEALDAMQKDDIVFKGANLLNYDKKEAAVTVAAGNGGTVGLLQPYTSGDAVGHLIVPVGLEKETFGDFKIYEELLSTKDLKKANFVPRIILHKDAEIFTEIEAIKTFANVELFPFSVGGINGREGGISLAVYGDAAEVEKVLHLVESIQGESPFIN